MNLKTDATAKRKEKKDQQQKELETLALDEIFSFQNQIKEGWQQIHQTMDASKRTAPQDEKNTQEPAKKEVNIHLGSIHLQSAQQSFEQMQDQHIRQQLKKELTRDYELGEHLFEIDIQNLGKIGITADIQKDMWRFSLKAENPHTQIWLSQQRDDLLLNFNQSRQNDPQNAPKEIALNVV